MENSSNSVLCYCCSLSCIESCSCKSADSLPRTTPALRGCGLPRHPRHAPARLPRRRTADCVVRDSRVCCRVGMTTATARRTKRPKQDQSRTTESSAHDQDECVWVIAFENAPYLYDLRIVTPPTRRNVFQKVSSASSCASFPQFTHIVYLP